MNDVAVEKRAITAAPIVNGSLVLRDTGDIMLLAQRAVNSGIVPKGTTTDQAYIKIVHGLEVGFKPMQALQKVHVINNRPGIYGDDALALVRRSGLMKSISIVPIGDDPGTRDKAQWPDNFGYKVATIRTDGLSHEVTFTVKDAKRAGLWNKTGPWQEYTKNMLRSRALTFNLRQNFSDVLSGIGIVEELKDIPEDSEYHIQAPPAGTSADAALLDVLQQQDAKDAEYKDLTKPQQNEPSGADEPEPDETAEEPTGDDMPPDDVDVETGEIQEPPEPDDDGNDAEMAHEALAGEIAELMKSYPDLQDGRTAIGKQVREICHGRSRDQLSMEELTFLMNTIQKHLHGK